MPTTSAAVSRQPAHRPSKPNLVAIDARHTGEAANRWTGARVAGYSLLILFFELAFIRFISGYVRVFGFYSNFVLIATFLGMGVGLLQARASRMLKWIAVPAGFMLVGAVAFFSMVRITAPRDPNEFLWGVWWTGTPTKEIPIMPVVVMLFGLCALFFVPLGSLLGTEFRKLPPLKAYSFDILGSLLGIASFALLSIWRQPPVVWFALGLGVWAVLSIRDWRFALSLGVAGSAVLSIASWVGGSVTRGEGRMTEYWSPYYRVTLQPNTAGYRIDVNGSMHQVMLPLTPADGAQNPLIAQVRNEYLGAYQFVRHLDTVLVVGSGSGNDVSLLLGQGAKYIDAVEIDPVIADIGIAGSPQRAYADPRVHLHIDDARAFLRKTTRAYDLIIFGTLDSQTLLSGMSSVRLDNYVYTVESFASARTALKADGTLLAYHMSAKQYIAANIYQMLRQSFGAEPGVIFRPGYLFNYIFIAGDGAKAVPPMEPVRLGELRANRRLPHDNWPYLYLSGRTIPVHYIEALLSVLLIAGVFMAVAGGSAVRRGTDAAMFLMGAGFLLVETKSVTEMSLLFGSTWTVNVLVFASILMMVLAANLLVLRRPPQTTRRLFAGLLGSLALAYVVPVSALLRLGHVPQWIIGGLLVALPVFFASLIFSTLLHRRTDATRALAYNLLGAIVGGMVEYSSMAFGVKALYLLAGAIYAGALLLSRREERAAA